jgi:hypothetical protein
LNVPRILSFSSRRKANQSILPSITYGTITSPLRNSHSHSLPTTLECSTHGQGIPFHPTFVTESQIVLQVGDSCSLVSCGWEMSLLLGQIVRQMDLHYCNEYSITCKPINSEQQVSNTHCRNEYSIICKPIIFEQQVSNTHCRNEYSITCKKIIVNTHTVSNTVDVLLIKATTKLYSPCIHSCPSSTTKWKHPTCKWTTRQLTQTHDPLPWYLTLHPSRPLPIDPFHPSPIAFASWH